VNLDLSLLTREQVVYLDWQSKWTATARPDQVIPRGDWTECGVVAGRGYGKTRVGAEWLAREVFEDPSGFDSCVIAPTYPDVIMTCFRGESGLLSVIPPELVVGFVTDPVPILKMRNIAGGVSQIRGFTAEKPERLRGPQHCRAWYDELAAWQYDEETWKMADFGLRLGVRPQILWTSTPKPKQLIRDLMLPKKDRILIRGSTYDNRENLADSFIEKMEDEYEGTLIGRQELYGELIDPEESGIIKRSDFRLWPANKLLPQFDFIVLSLDTAFTERTFDKKSGDADPTACVVLGSFSDKNGHRHIMVLDCWQDHLGLPALLRRVKKELDARYGDDQDAALIKPKFGSDKPLTSGRKPDLCLIEDKGSGISLRQMLDADGIAAFPYNPGRADKLTRLHAVSHIFARQRIWLPESNKHTGKPMTWCEPMVEQICSFTGPGSTRHDDFVDAMTQGVRLLIDKGLVTVLRKPPRDIREVPPPSPVVNPYAV
jgi:predicted phage terminase large subunit-like protein